MNQNYIALPISFIYSFIIMCKKKQRGSYDGGYGETIWNDVVMIPVPKGTKTTDA